MNFRSQVARSPNYYLLLQNGDPFEVSFFNGPTFPRLSGNMIGSFIRDSWTVGRRLTLNLGLRYDHQQAFAPDNCREAALPPSDVIFPASCFARVDLPVFNNVAPRLHAAYDLSGDGKTVLKGGWGRYYDMRHLNPDVLRVTKNGIAYGIFRWHDLNGNLDYDDGEVDRDLNGDDYVETSGRQFETQQPPAVTNPDEKQPQNDQFSLALERELISNFSLRVTGAYTRATNILPHSEQPATLRVLQRAGHESGPRPRRSGRNCRRRRLVHVLRVPDRASWTKIRGVDAHQRPEGRSELPEF